MPKIFHSRTKLIIPNSSNIDKAFGSMHQSILTKMKNSVSKGWIIKTIAKNDIKIFVC